MGFVVCFLEMVVWEVGGVVEVVCFWGDFLIDFYSYYLVGISFFILGLGILFFWNFFITVISVRYEVG